MKENDFDSLLEQVTSGARVSAAMWRTLISELGDEEKQRLTLMARQTAQSRFGNGVYVRLAVPVIYYGIFGAVCVARACNATSAEIGYFIVCLYARRACLVHHMQHIAVLY